MGFVIDSLIPLSIPNFEGREKEYVLDALNQGWVSTGGAYITRLEQEMATFLHVGDVAACQSGTAALHLSLIEAGVMPNDVVLVPPLTFIAAVNPIKYQLATPVFIDCDGSLCMDPEKLDAFCREECVLGDGALHYKGRVVKAVVVVHVFGNMADMEAIMDTAAKYHLKVIEDATEALGTRYTGGRYAGKYAGTIGDFGAYSFNGNKIITTGGGGAVTAGNSKAVAHMRYLSTQAKDSLYGYTHREVGYNYRMTNLQAALGVAQMEELPEFIRRKQHNYELYKKALEGFALARLLPFREGTDANQWFYALEVDQKKVRVTMQNLVNALERERIQARAVWGLINEQEPYKGEEAYRLEMAPYYAARVLNLPCSTQITEEEIAYVAKVVKQLLKGFANG